MVVWHVDDVPFLLKAFSNSMFVFSSLEASKDPKRPHHLCTSSRPNKKHKWHLDSEIPFWTTGFLISTNLDESSNMAPSNIGVWLLKLWDPIYHPPNHPPATRISGPHVRQQKNEPGPKRTWCWAIRWFPWWHFNYKLIWVLRIKQQVKKNKWYIIYIIYIIYMLCIYIINAFKTQTALSLLSLYIYMSFNCQAGANGAAHTEHPFWQYHAQQGKRTVKVEHVEGNGKGVDAAKPRTSTAKKARK